MKFALRQLLKHPGFTLVAVLSLALGIGVNTMMFSFFNGYLLRPVPVIKEPRRIAQLQRGDSLGSRSAFSWHEYEGFREHNDVFSKLIAYTGPHGGTLTLGDGPNENNSTSTTRPEGEEVRAQLVSADYFSMLGVEAAQGRTFNPEEGKGGASSPPVVVLSHGLWQRRFGSDAGVIGKTVKLNSRSFTVIGITPKNFPGLGEGLLVTDAWVPVSTLAELEGNSDWGQLQKEFRFQLAGRLKPGLSVEQAASALNAIDPQIAAPTSSPDHRVWLGLKNVGAFMSFAENAEVMLPIMTAVGFVLLIACANVANLLLARAADRQKELGIRLALGAGRSRIARQLLTESILIALLGGACGLMLGMWACRFAWNLRGAFLPPDIQLAELELSPDLRVFAYTLLLSLGTGIVFGLVPALEASRANLTSALKDEGVFFGRRLSRARLRNLFAITQIAGCLSLLLGAGLLLRAGQKASTVEFGYHTQDIILARFDLHRHGYTVGRAAEFQRQLMERMSVLPGVKSLCLARHTLAGREHVDTVSPEYFNTMGIPIVRGRHFSEQDGRNGVPVVIVSQATAQRLWGDQEPIGKRMTNAPFAEVIGVARNTRNLFECLFSNARPSATLPNAALHDYLYLPHATTNPELLEMQMLLRVEGDSRTLVAALREHVQRLDPTVVISVGPLTRELAGGLRLFRGLTGLAQTIGLVALLLAAMGIYGVMAYAVSQRTREIGIRMALGARKSDVFRWVLEKGGRLILLGLALGFPGGVMLSSYLASLLVGLSSTDPMTLGGVSFFLGAVGLLACYLPARRATQVEPMVALRCE